MVGQYFKRRREAVEIALVGSSGIGLALMTVFLHTTLGYGTRSSCQCVQQYTEVVSVLSLYYYSHYSQYSLMQCHRLALGSAGCHRPRLVDLHSRILLQVGLSLPPAKESHSTFKEPTKESTAISAISSIRKFYYFFFNLILNRSKRRTSTKKSHRSLILLHSNHEPFKLLWSQQLL